MKGSGKCSMMYKNNLLFSHQNSFYYSCFFAMVISFKRLLFSLLKSEWFWYYRDFDGTHKSFVSSSPAWEKCEHLMIAEGKQSPLWAMARTKIHTWMPIIWLSKCTLKPDFWLTMPSALSKNEVYLEFSSNTSVTSLASHFDTPIVGNV